MLFYTIIFLHICTVYNQHPFLGLVFNTLVVQHSQHDLLPFRPPCDVALPPPPSRDSNSGRAIWPLDHDNSQFFFLFLKRIFGCPQDYFTKASASVFMVLIQRYINFYYKACFLNWLWKEKNTDQNITNGIEEFNWRVAQLHAVAVRLSCTWFRTSDSKLWLQLLTRKVVSERIYSI